MTSRECKPWLEDDDAPEVMRGLLESARADGPTSAELERLARRLSPAVGVAAASLVASSAAGAVAPLSPGAAAMSPGLFAKLSAGLWLKLVGAATVAGAGLYFALAPTPPASTPAPRPAPREHRPEAPPVARETPPPRAEPAIGQAPSVSPPAPAAPEVAASSRPRPRRDQAPPSELSLLRAAQAEGVRPERALALLDTHARHYPQGMLAEEREVLAIGALLTLGKRQEAEGRARRFFAAYPGSLQQRRVRVLLDGASTD